MVHPGYVNAVFKRDSVDYHAVVATMCAVCAGRLPVPDGAVLVFLPGVIEIKKLAHLLDAAIEAGRLTSSVQVLELHGSLTPEDQVRVSDVSMSCIIWFHERALLFCWCWCVLTAGVSNW